MSQDNRNQSKDLTRRRIQVLPESLANKIAAGEVIQRPESVVKELLENALDAGAQHIVLVIREGGKKQVQVVDDGMGMDEQDACASFLRHATNKIVDYEDLEEIRTYGFRGEALASIAAVSRVTMKTRQPGEELAVVVQVDGGSSPRVSREARECGTTILVNNLFYNVPARRKFLKSNTTEFRHVYDAVQRVALSHPELALQLVSEDEIILDLKQGSLHERVLDLFGERLADGLISFEERSEIISLSGYVGKPTFGQKSRALQFLFLNRRFILNRNINHAVYSAYEHLLTKGTFPFFILFLEIDPRRVDVNVHPSKLEAKFEDEQSIYRFVSTVVRKVLASKEFIPALSTGEAAPGGGVMDLDFTRRQHSWPSAEWSAPGSLAEKQSPSETSPTGGEIARQLLLSPQDQGSPDAAPRYPLLWQLHDKYILVPIEHGLMVIDQHVAHERVLYEKMLARFNGPGSPPQQVLFPHTVELTSGDYALLIELQPHLEMLGFAFKPFGKNTVVVEGVPSDLRSDFNEKVLTDLLGLYREYHQEAPLEVRDNLAKSFSCRAAIKAGDRLTNEEMRVLVDQLFKTSMPFVCPHGRPVVLRISLEEFDRRFGRI
jgi:DNA mismatch repair protein MutL